jgi:FixJ family two-component response regulator
MEGRVVQLAGSLVVVVEDDVDMRNAMRRVLTTASLVTEAFESAEALLASDAASRAKCLVLDIRLAGMSGFELQERLVAEGISSPVVFITAQDLPTTRKRALQATDFYLVKPFLSETLIAAVTKAMASRSVK